MHTILIVEDEKLIRQGIKMMIQRSGVPVDNIVECNNGVSALAMLDTQEVDVVFTDIRMPKMDGIELVNRIQNLEHKPLIVVISGYDDFSYAVEMLRNGVREYLLKPIDREKIKEVMNKLEKELHSIQEAKKQEQTIEVSQLKYFITTQTIDPSEEKLMLAQYSSSFFEEDFIVCQISKQEKHYEEKLPYVVLNNIDNQDVYVTIASYLPVLLKDDLLKYTTGISKPHRGLEELRIAYKEARKARKKAFYLCKNVKFEDVSNNQNAMELKDNMILQISQLLGTSRYEDGIQQLERILTNVKLGSYTISRVEEALNLLLDSICETYQNVFHLEPSEIEKYRLIYSFDNVMDYWHQLKIWLLQLSVILNNEYDDYKNKQKIAQAIQYIKENYNKDLNMAVVSNHISMNYSLFSYAFKQYTGNNFVNYLKEIRMNEARRLLKETDDKINEISQQVGYENDKHFMKLFKTECGVSPTEYRKNMQFKGK